MPLNLLARLSAALLFFCTSFVQVAEAMPDQDRIQQAWKDKLPQYLAKSLGSLLTLSQNHPGLKRLIASVQFSAVQDSLSQRFAVFSAVGNKIVINNTLAKQLPEQQILVMAHEVGHAFVYAKMTPQEVLRWSEAYGPWSQENLSNQPPKNFEDAILMSPHPLKEATPRSIGQLNNTPSRYALSNRHEWMAECFATWLSSELNQTKRSKPLAKLTKDLDQNLTKAFEEKLSK